MFTVFTIKGLFSDVDYDEVLDVYIDRVNDVDSDAPTGTNALSPVSSSPKFLSSNFYEISTNPSLQ